MALDIGAARVGIAVSDPDGRIASPLKVMDARTVLSDAPEFRRLVEDWEVEALVCGLPLTLSGEHGPQAKTLEGQARKIAAARGLPVYFADERLSSQEAKRILREEGLDERAMRGKVDSVAASLFLQAWLDAHVRNASDEGAEADR